MSKIHRCPHLYLNRLTFAKDRYNILLIHIAIHILHNFMEVPKAGASMYFRHISNVFFFFFFFFFFLFFFVVVVFCCCFFFFFFFNYSLKCFWKLYMTKIYMQLGLANQSWKDNRLSVLPLWLIDYCCNKPSNETWYPWLNTWSAYTVVSLIMASVRYYVLKGYYDGSKLKTMQYNLDR